jgi:glycosyltransferase involved in cell wall biosynthesis
MRVLHVASGDLWAGAEVQLYNLACALHAGGSVDLRVVLLNEGLLAERLAAAGIAVTIIDERSLSSLRILLALSRLIRAEAPDLVHTHRVKENVLGSLAALARPGTPGLRTVHGATEYAVARWDLRKRVPIWFDWLAAVLLQRRIVCVSEPLAGALAERYPRAKLVVIENGIDVDALRREAARSVELPGPRDRVRVALVGRLVPVKRVDLFLELARTLAGSHSGRFSFYLIGDGPLLPSVRDYIARHGLAASVFATGFMADAAPALAAMDALCITSDHEGLPMTVLEAMALEVPVIAHAVGGIVQALDGGACGTLLQSQDLRGFAEALIGLIERRDDYRGRAARALERVGQRYSAVANARAYLSLYAELAG